MILESFALPTLIVPVVGKFIIRKISFNSLTVFPFNSTSPYAFSAGPYCRSYTKKRKYIWQDSGMSSWHRRRMIDALVLVMAPLVALMKCQSTPP